MKRLFHDAQNLGILPAIDPNDAGRIEPEAAQAGRITVGPARSPQHEALAALQDAGRHRCGKRRHGRRQLGLHPVRPELVKRAKLQAAAWKRRVETPICKGQNAAASRCFQMMALKQAHLHPKGIERIHDTI